MKDIEAELKRLRREADDVLERETRIKEREYYRLTLLAMLFSVAAVFAQYLAKVSFPHVRWQEWFVGFVSFLVTILLAGFSIRAYRSLLGIRGYLKVEKTLLINEMPNIFQILSLLGFLNVLLKQQLVKIIVTVVITFLLLIYLTSRRRDMVSQSPALEGKVTPEVTTLLSIILGCIIGSVVYGLASLVSVQIH